MSSDFEQKLLATFRIEAQENLDSIGAGLVQAEQPGSEASQAALVETMFRQAHSLKGAARSVGATAIAGVCQILEEIFARLKKRQLAPSAELWDAMHQAVTGLKAVMAEPAAQSPGHPEIARITAQLRRWTGDQGSGSPPANAAAQRAPAPAEKSSPPAHLSGNSLEKAVLPETVRIATAKLDSVLFQAEDLLSARLAAGQRLEELQRVEHQLSHWRGEWARLGPRLKPGHRGRGATAAPPPPQRLSDFLEWNARLVQSVSAELARLLGETSRDHRALTGMVDTLLDTTKEALMLPFSQLLELLPVIVRDLAREQQKDVDLRVSGGAIAIDRRILEELRDAFIHLIRNSIDHGIETPDRRRQAHKPPRGTIQVSITQTAPGQVEIVLGDDGVGIDTDALKAAAAKSGVRAPVSESRSEALQLIFESGLSTAPAVTDISGRGLGLAIVREKVEKLGGSISVNSTPGQGTEFHIVVPNTLARFRGVLITAGGVLLMIPTTTIERVVRTPAADIKRVENRDTISLEGQTVPLVRLEKLLRVPTTAPADSLGPSQRIPAVVIGAGERRVALAVDEVHFEQDVLMKSLGPQLVRVRHVAGATVLGNGKVVPVLNASDLLKAALRSADAQSAGPAPPAPAKTAPPKSVLVAEDSFTSRSLLKHILQTAGYRVETAVDGADALSWLRRGGFDVLVSDVDMPKLNGFDLTTAVRRDPKLTNLPVVLVTALASPGDRARGIEAGANAYVIKSSFDQSNLLEVVKGLVH